MSILAHWHHLADDFNTSALDFYAAVEEAVKAREIPDCEFSREDFSESGIASAKREYLRIRRRKISFDLCAAPYGRGYFFSSWLVKPGPEQRWLWLVGLLGAVLVWLAVTLGALTNSLTGRSGSGCFLIIAIIAFPVLVWAFCWAVREGQLGIDEDDVLMIPVLGFIYRLFYNPYTYFELDSALMFQESVSRVVGEVVNDLLSEQGLKMLSEDELKPTIRDLAR